MSLARRFNLPSSLMVARGLENFQKLGMVELGIDGTIRLVNFAKRQAADSAKSRQAAWRERHPRNENVTRPPSPPEPSVTQNVTRPLVLALPEVELEKEIEKKETKTCPQRPADRVFAHWVEVMGKGKRAQFDRKRLAAVEKQLAAGRTVEELKLAIDGCKLSPHNMGQNETHTKYDDLALICRDAEHVEKFIALAEAKRPRVRTPAVVEETAEERERRVKAKYDAEIAALDGRKVGQA